jgi:hypothetical protein
VIGIQLSEVIYGRRHFGDVLDICKRELAGIVVPPYPMRVLVPNIQAVAHGRSCGSKIGVEPSVTYVGSRSLSNVE